MLSRDWLLVIALGGCLACDQALAQSKEPPADPHIERQQDSARSDQTRTPDGSATPSPDAKAPLQIVIPDAVHVIVREKEQPTAEPYRPDCERPKNHDEADLCQQERMARAAEDAVVVARDQYNIALLAFIGLVLTLAANFGATVAALRGNSISRRNFREDQRAWIHIAEFEIIKPLLLISGKGGQAKARAVLKNCGRTPAQNCSFYPKLVLAGPNFHMGDAEQNFRNELEAKANRTKRGNISAAIFPGEPAVWEDIVLQATSKELDAATVDSETLGKFTYPQFFLGVTYLDVYGHPHFTMATFHGKGVPLDVEAIGDVVVYQDKVLAT